MRRLSIAIDCLLLTVAICALASACGSGPTRPSSQSVRYDGQWSGTTADGRPITFIVSPDQKVTAITVEYSINGCFGVKTFTDLRLDIDTSQTRSALRPGFTYSTGPAGGPDRTDVLGTFVSSTSANGSVLLVNYSGCGNGGGFWTASKR